MKYQVTWLWLTRFWFAEVYVKVVNCWKQMIWEVILEFEDFFF